MSRIGLPIGRRVTRVCVVAVSVGSVGATAVLAQGPSQSITALLTMLQSSVNALQESVNTITAPGQANVRFTPWVLFQSGSLHCAVVNVTAEERQVMIELIHHTGEFEGGDILTIPPGHARSVNIVAPGPFQSGGTLYCKFTVLNGTRTDIRASLLINEITPLPPSGNTLLSVLAE